MKHTLEVDSVMLQINDKTILGGAYITCQTGEIVGLLGRNGSGKSSLLKIIFGSLEANSRTILIDKQWYDKPFKHKKLVAYLPQDSFLPRHAKVKKVLNMIVPNKADRERISTDPRIQRQLHKKVSYLSGGELRYLEINLILSLNVHFILVDEPFTGIEPLYIEYIKELLTQTKDKGIIITDHLYQNILDMSDRLVVMKNGHTHAINDRQELKKLGYVPQEAVI